MKRRDALRAGMALASSTALGACDDVRRARSTSSSSPTEVHVPSDRSPTLFVAHGAPPLLDDAAWMAELSALGSALGKPKALLVLSAHWEARPLSLGATSPQPLVYDFYGFPRRFYELRYDAPGAPELATEIERLLGRGNVTRDERRGLDHGVYVPLLPMFPSADVPVLQASLPSLEAPALLELGTKLAPLRDQGVLVVASGFVTHNLRSLGRHPSGPPSWATDFDAWVADALNRHDYDALAQYAARAPGVRESLPTHEHFAPLLVAAGAAMGEPVAHPIEGWAFGSFSKRSTVFGG
jgi:4,5-DOPA dioxygenase extradiol